MVRSYSPGRTSQQPFCCSTAPRMWKNCPTLSRFALAGDGMAAA